MKRTIESKKIFNVTSATNLAELKTTYRNLMKEWHPDKFKEDDAQLEMAEAKSKTIGFMEDEIFFPRWLNQFFNVKEATRMQLTSITAGYFFFSDFN